MTRKDKFMAYLPAIIASIGSVIFFAYLYFAVRNLPDTQQETEVIQSNVLPLLEGKVEPTPTRVGRFDSTQQRITELLVLYDDCKMRMPSTNSRIRIASIQAQVHILRNLREEYELKEEKLYK